MLTEADIAKLDAEHFHLFNHDIDNAALSQPTITPCTSNDKSSSRSSKGKKTRYVYDYSQDKLRRIKDGEGIVHQKGFKEVPIPFKPGRLPIHIDGTENIAAFVNISAELRFLRWIGAQDKLYVVGSCDGVES